MLPQEIIRRKRDGNTLGRQEISEFIEGVTSKTVSEGQIAALCMAIFFRGLEPQERVALTSAMAGSGTVIDWTAENLPGPVLDKHSTGGVGDKVSLVLAPVMAACGAFVPMISGRGLGHTGGTLDKMDSIPGYVSQPPLPLLKKVVRETGSAIVGATADIAPADRIMYAVRDVTGTVESLDLITTSILSKKLAAGLQGLVMDVKFGTGAFLPDYEKATALARSIIAVASGAGLACAALMTDMNEVLGRTAGNAVEVREAIECLRGEPAEPRFYDVTMALCAELLVLGGLEKTPEQARKKAEAALASGQAAERFARSVAALGGPADIVEHYDRHLPLAPLRREIAADGPGYLHAVDTRGMGLAVIELGGGRRLVSDKIDHGTGILSAAATGDKLGPGEKPLAVICGRDEAALDRAEALIRAACRTAPTPPPAKGPAVRERIASS